MPVHFITCYVHNGTGKEGTQDIQRLDHILSLILTRLPYSRIVIAGDFNQQMDQAYRICHKFGLRETIHKGQPTHNKGGHLDQIFTNIEGLEAKLEDSELTDHKQIRLQIRFIKSQQDVDIDNLPTKITQADIRKAATSTKTIEKIKQMSGDILQNSMMEIIGEDIVRRPLMDQWYK